MVSSRQRLGKSEDDINFKLGNNKVRKVKKQILWELLHVDDQLKWNSHIELQKCKTGLQGA